MSDQSIDLGRAAFAVVSGFIIGGVGASELMALDASDSRNEEGRQLVEDMKVYSGKRDEVNSLFSAAGKGLVFFDLPNGKKCAIRVDADLTKPTLQAMVCEP